jgi:dodecin
MSAPAGLHLPRAYDQLTYETPHYSKRKDTTMAVAKVLEITSSSTKSFDDAIRLGIARAEKTLDQVQGAWIQDQTVIVNKGKISEYRVRMRVTFVLKA